MRTNRQYMINKYPNPWEILDEAVTVSRKCFVDKLDCSKSFARENTDLTYEEAKPLFEDKLLHFAFIQHKGFLDENDYYDVGVSTQAGHPNYFIFFYISIEDGEKVAEKYNLELFEI